MNVAELKARYTIDDKWRTAWTALANKKCPERPARTLNQQEYIESRAGRANHRIKLLMDQFDTLVATGKA